MNQSEFTYWLKGFFELSGSNELSNVQVQIIKDHLDLVFNKVTPYRSSIGTANGDNSLHTTSVSTERYGTC